MSDLVILIPPEIDAVSLLEVHAYLRVASDADDVTLLTMLKAAITSVEARNNCALISRKIRQSFTRADINTQNNLAQKLGGAIYLRPAFTPDSISEVRHIDSTGTAVIAPNLVAIENEKFALKSYANVIEIDYFAGFAAPSDVPHFLKIEVLEEVARLIAVRDNEEAKQHGVKFTSAQSRGPKL